MSDTIQVQKELYKNHLEFLGYRVEYDTDDEQAIVAIAEGKQTFLRVFTYGLCARRGYRTSAKAQSERWAFLEFVNKSNKTSITKMYVDEEWVINELWYLHAYEKVSFGEFMSILQEEADGFEEFFLSKIDGLVEVELLFINARNKAIPGK